MRVKCRAMTVIMHIFMVLVVVVSAFFYAPMEVRASSDLNSSVTLDSPTVVSGNDIGHLDVSGSYSNWNYHYYDGYVQLGHINFGSSFDADKVYKVSMYTRLDTHLGVQGLVRAVDIFQPMDEFGYKTSDVLLNFRVPDNNTGLGYDFYSEITSDYYFTGEFLNDNDLSLTFVGLVPKTSSQFSKIDVTFNFQYLVYSVEELTDDESEQYQDGYNAGYAEGESAGYGNGYSSGYADGEASVDTGAIYDEAFQAGKDSVDTDSYYDAGYEAGYQAAYSEGYESGYDVGYQSAMDRITSWGSDTTNYPVLLHSKESYDSYIIGSVKSSIPLQYVFNSFWTFTEMNFNPNHTYRFDVNLSYDIDEYTSSDIYFLEDNDWYLGIGSLEYKLSLFDSARNNFYIPGDRMATSFQFIWKPICAIYGDTMDSDTAYCDYNVSFSIYDMGPSGDTQNHIANQTDQLTNGYDSSQGAVVNDDFKASVNEYHTAEDSLFSTATTSLENFTFLDFTSITGMVTSLSFVTSIMTSIYMAMGGDTGASGIVLAVLFSVMLVSMAIGLYRYYVSNGKSDGNGKGGD